MLYLTQIRDPQALQTLEQLLELETVESVCLAVWSAIAQVTNLLSEYYLGFQGNTTYSLEI